MTEPQSAVLSVYGNAARRLAKLDRAVQARYAEFQSKFCANMDLPGLRLKRLQGDRRLWSARITDDYRAILCEVARAHFVLIDVAPRQSSYDRIDHRYTAHVNGVTGAFEVADFDEIHSAVAESERSPEPAAPAHPVRAVAVTDLFKDYPDDVLLDFGVAAPLLPAIRQIATGDQLKAFCDVAPRHTAEILNAIDAGFTLAEIEEFVTAPVRAPEPVDTSDFAAAVERRTSYVTSSDAAVTAMLDGRFEAWRLWTHPTQQQLIDRTYKGPARVSGGPGTGKTVVALHRTARLARGLDPASGERILLTTFTRNLAADLKSKLGLLLDQEALARVDVEHLDAVVHRLAREQGDLGALMGDDDMLAAWEQVRSDRGETEFDADFLLSEWNDVVCAQLVTSRAEYLQARRVKRPRRLNRIQRARVWELVERFNKLLAERGAWCWPQVRATTAVAEKHRLKGDYRYRHIVIDEAQDLTPAHWVLLRALVPEAVDDLFITGDTFQRIYGQPVTLGQLGIDIRGRSKRLTLNYRTTREILLAALAIGSGAQADDLDGDTDSLAGYRSVMSGALPEFRPQTTPEAELATIATQVRAWTEAHGTGGIAVAVPLKAMAAKVIDGLNAAGVPAAALAADAVPSSDTVHVGTMHRLKGLEYRFMMVSGIGADKFPYGYVRKLADTDPQRFELEMAKARNLLFVAATRARDAVVFTWTGEPSPLLRLAAA
ncbi:UvrD-helicase domain-containing protein [Glycomyces sp. NPDC021274]|uniref:UvrD-helicase domain-containing protein n=1 Tax=Glycomyces sp. NPDC021274 TaxID=3155120 RepID=UPI00340FD9F8